MATAAQGSTCPVCRAIGRSGELSLRQVNAEDAVFVCDNPKCPYPVGLDPRTVHRPVVELKEAQDMLEGLDFLLPWSQADTMASQHAAAAPEKQPTNEGGSVYCPPTTNPAATHTPLTDADDLEQIFKDFIDQDL